MNGVAGSEQYGLEHDAQFLSELTSFLSIPSVSMDQGQQQAVTDAATYLCDRLAEIGLRDVQCIHAGGAPIVYAQWCGAEQGAPTILVYGHYDVQPSGNLSDWVSPPFTPTVRAGALYARGASDDKGQLFLHLKAVECILRTAGRLAVNVKFLIEGEEETGSQSLLRLLHRLHSDPDATVLSNEERTASVDLAADAVVISDTPFLFPHSPALCMGTRGLCGVEVDVEGPAFDLHSGGYGGLVENPIHALATLVASLHTASGSIAIDGFYDDVRPILPAEREMLACVSPAETDLIRLLGAPQLYGESGYSPLERIWLRPSLHVNRFIGGDLSDPARTIIPQRASATITARLALGQDPTRVTHCLIRHVRSVMPATVTTRIRELDEARAWMTDSSHPVFAHAAEALQHGFGADVSYIRMGGTIPVVSELSDALHIPVVLMGFGLPSDNIHAPNENFSISQWHQGMRTLIQFYQTRWQTGVEGVKHRGPGKYAGFHDATGG